MSVVTAEIDSGSRATGSSSGSQSLFESKAVAAALKVLQNRVETLKDEEAKLQDGLYTAELEAVRAKDEHLAASLLGKTEAKSRENALQRKLSALESENAALLATEQEKEQKVAALQAQLAALESSRSEARSKRQEREKALQAQLEEVRLKDSAATQRLDSLCEQLETATAEIQSLRAQNLQTAQLIEANHSEISAVHSAFRKLQQVVDEEAGAHELRTQQHLSALTESEQALAAKCAALQEKDAEVTREMQMAKTLLEAVKRRAEPPSLRIPEHPLAVTAVSCKPRPPPDAVMGISELERDICVLAKKCKRMLDQVSTPTAAGQRAQEVSALTALIDKKTKQLAHLKRGRQAAIRTHVIDSL